MLDLNSLQKRIFQNKVDKGFNTTNLHLEFNLLHEEVVEACAAYRKKLPDLGEELADVAIYLLGISEILGVNLEEQIVQKVEKNEKRKYQEINGVHVRTEG